MRFLIPVMLLVLVSCGKSGSSNGGPRQEEEFNEGIDNITETDLLDVTVDVPVEISGNKIIFRKASNQLVSGAHSTCNLSVENGESWDYSVSGRTLSLYRGRGKTNMVRVGEGSGIVGSWVSKGYEGSQFIVRRVTFVSLDRVIMRAHCEQ